MELIKDEISIFTMLPQFRDWALEVLRESHKDETIYKDIENQLNSLVDMKLKGQITDDEYNPKRE